jgi:hypothetical protein
MVRSRQGPLDLWKNRSGQGKTTDAQHPPQSPKGGWDASVPPPPPSIAYSSCSAVSIAAAAAVPELWEGRSKLQEVAPRVFISNYFAARSRPLLTAAGVTHVRRPPEEI